MTSGNSDVTTGCQNGVQYLNSVDGDLSRDFSDIVG